MQQFDFQKCNEKEKLLVSNVFFCRIILIYAQNMLSKHPINRTINDNLTLCITPSPYPNVSRITNEIRKKKILTELGPKSNLGAATSVMSPPSNSRLMSSLSPIFPRPRGK
jgi:hypothetical protein